MNDKGGLLYLDMDKFKKWKHSVKQNGNNMFIYQQNYYVKQLQVIQYLT